MQTFRTKGNPNITNKFMHINIGFIFLIICVTSIGFLSLYSASGGSLSPWAFRQIVRFGIGFVAMIGIALIDIRFWYKNAWGIYIIFLLMLIVVEVKGHVGMGAQRWINLGFINIQPSEFMKIALTLVMAKYFQNINPFELKRVVSYIPPAMMVLAPVVLVMLQPDLGTALMSVMLGIGIIFCAGAPLWIFGVGLVGTGIAIPVGWQFLHDYQKNRVLTFLNPENDPLGTGYHIRQSKIALGSGGIEGKGFLQGTQSHLNFLPEKQTDFIFTLWAEEWGLIGGLFLLGLFAGIFIYGNWIAMNCRHSFGKILAFGLTLNYALYVFVNIAMVMGLIPVVGAPLPLVSYGGTSMLASLIGFGLIISCHIHRDHRKMRY